MPRPYFVYSMAKKKCNIPTHQHLPSTWAKTYPCDCPQGCGQQVFYFECGHGSKVFFQELGEPWRNHFADGLCPNQEDLSDPPPLIIPEPEKDNIEDAAVIKRSAVYYSWGIKNYKSGKYKSAIDFFTRAIDKNPGYMHAYNYRGLAKSSLGQYESAISDYDVAIRLTPHDPILYFNRGYSKYYSRQYESAIVDFTIAISRKPDYARAYYYRGLAKKAVYYDRGLAKNKRSRLEQVKQDWETALKLSKNDNELKNWIEASFRLLK